MSEPKKKSYWKLLVLLILIAALPFGLQFGINTYLNSYLTNLKNKVEQSPDIDYRFSFRSVHFSILRSSLFISGISIRGTDSLKGISTFSTEHISVEGIGVVSFLRHKKVVIDKIAVNDAVISIRANPDAAKDTVENTDNKKFLGPYELFKDKLKSVFISQIMIGNTKISYFDTVTDSLPSLTSDHSSVIFENLLVDSATTYIQKRWFDAKRFLIVSKDFKYATKDSLYIFNFGQLTLSYADSIIQIDSFSMTPGFNEKEFARRVGKQTDMMTVKAGNITMNHVSVKRILEKRRFIIPLVKIENCTIQAYRDKNIPRIEKEAPTVQNLVRKIPIYLKVDSVVMKNGFIQYRELVPGAPKAGEIFFAHLDGSIAHLTNDTLLHDQVMTAQATAKFLGAGNINGTFQFPYKQNGHYSFNGRLGHLDMKKLNPMLENNAAISIKEGFIDDVVFSIKAVPGRSTGNMVFKYNSLDIEVLNKETREGSAIKELFTSAIANKMVLINDNPKKNDEVRKATLDYNRNPNRFIFNDVWKTAMTGIIETLGAKQLADTVKKLKKELSKDKKKEKKKEKEKEKEKEKKEKEKEKEKNKKKDK